MHRESLRTVGEGAKLASMVDMACPRENNVKRVTIFGHQVLVDQRLPPGTVYVVAHQVKRPEEAAHLRKACNCKGATASGPRIVLTERRAHGANYVIKAELHNMVCDCCDTPWQRYGNLTS